jgi:four helix bundle protein
MSGAFTYRDLEVWKIGMELVEDCYRITTKFPTSELYGLTNQLRRAACSIPSNIAEGHCRRSTKAYANHISIALGSHGELETCIEIGSRLGFLSKTEREKLMAKCDSTGRLLNGLYRALKRKLRSLGNKRRARSAARLQTPTTSP